VNNYHLFSQFKRQGSLLPIGNIEVLLPSLDKSQGRACSVADITELLSFRRKFILASDVNAKHPLWNSSVSIPSGVKLLHLFDVNQSEISVPECPNQYSPMGNFVVLDIVVHQKISVK
jgi:hypothetical protein